MVCSGGIVLNAWALTSLLATGGHELSYFLAVLYNCAKQSLMLRRASLALMRRVSYWDPPATWISLAFGVCWPVGWSMLTVSGASVDHLPYDKFFNRFGLRLPAHPVCRLCDQFYSLWFKYVGAACHPQPRVIGVANRLRRKPCFEGEYMLWHVVCQ